MKGTYEEFVQKYGKRPPDIVFAITQTDTARAIFEHIEPHVGLVKKQHWWVAFKNGYGVVK